MTIQVKKIGVNFNPSPTLLLFYPEGGKARRREMPLHQPCKLWDSNLCYCSHLILAEQKPRHIWGSGMIWYPYQQSRTWWIQCVSPWYSSTWRELDSHCQTNSGPSTSPRGPMQQCQRWCPSGTRNSWWGAWSISTWEMWLLPCHLSSKKHITALVNLLLGNWWNWLWQYVRSCDESSPEVGRKWKW